MRVLLRVFLAAAVLFSAADRVRSSYSPESAVTLLDDDFRRLTPGMFSAGVVGAHAEYHYLPALAPKGNWVVSTFLSDQSQRAWRVVHENGQAFMEQAYAALLEERSRTHPMLVAGDPAWSDYELETRFAPSTTDGQSGVVVRYRHDRAHYFAGVMGEEALLKKVNEGAAFRKLAETVLARKPFARRPGDSVRLRVGVHGDLLRAEFDDRVVLEAHDTTFPQGRVGLTSDVPTRFAAVRVSADPEAARRYESVRARREAEEEARVASNPRMVAWQKLHTDGFGVGRNLRFGDLDGDGRLDILIGQVVHHGPKDRHSELGCLTAMNLDGRVLWQSGGPDPWKDSLTNDVAFQIHDLDGDGRTEVVYCRDQELAVAEGATGRVLRRIPTPLVPTDDADRPRSPFPRILGDSLFFCDLRGTGKPRDIVLKDRYWHLWAFTDALEPLWDVALRAGHYPYAYDVDGDGRDELAVGYSLVDHDGRILWSHDRILQDHADGVAIVPLEEGRPPRLLCAASDEGIFFADLGGRILKHLQLGHVQNPSTADYRPDLPGLETVTINFWGNQGIVHFFDARGDPYHDFEPAQHGSMMLPVNWTGRPGEYWVLSPSVSEGGLFDGWGRRAVRFPADGHPDLCYSVVDLFSDCRDEIVVWDPYEIWVYTQDDNPRSGRLYKPKRNPLWNASNYQATVSLPGWSESR
jgi:rhamnogalacturonan endolyase